MRTCKTCGACKPLYICIHWGFWRSKQLYCTVSETLTEGGATCAAWRKSERGCDLSEARFDEIERDLHYLYEQLKDL